MKAIVLLNTGAGTLPGNVADIDLLAGLLRDCGIDAEMVSAPNSKIGDESRRAAQACPDLVLAGGGDGTVSAAASAVANTGIALGVLPLGTLNHFAKDLRIPLKLEDAVRLIAKGPVRAVDMGEVNGRYFINNSSLGVYPRLVKNREEQRLHLGIGKWPALLIGVFLAFRRTSDFRIEVISDNVDVIRRTPFVFIGNNVYDVSLFTIRNRVSLDRGVLSVYIGNRGGRLELLRLLLKAVTGTLNQAEDFLSLKVTGCLIRTGPKRATIALDGEILKTSTPLRYLIHPGALRVIAPEDDNE